VVLHQVYLLRPVVLPDPLGLPDTHHRQRADQKLQLFQPRPLQRVCRSLSVSPIHPTKVAAKNVFLIVSLLCFIFNEFAFAVHVKHSTQILGFLLICLYFTTGHFHTCTLPRMQPILYSLLILSSAFSNCVVFYGDFDINAKNIIPTLCGSGCLLPKLVIV